MCNLLTLVAKLVLYPIILVFPGFVMVPQFFIHQHPTLDKKAFLLSLIDII